MKPGTTKPNDRVARWIGFLALAALLAMATLPGSSNPRDVAASSNIVHWGATWHG